MPAHPIFARIFEDFGMARMSIDEKSAELAKHFLSDVKGATAEDETELAEAIQSLCESFCRDIEQPDPRDPDHSRPGIFAHHNCARCGDGARPCVQGKPSQCEHPRARND